MAPGRGSQGEEGFVLLESIVAISLIAVLLAALGTFTLNSVSATNQLRARQAATHIATSTMASLAAVPATDLLTGRDSTTVHTWWLKGKLNPLVDPWLTDTKEATGPGSTPTIPIAPPAPTILNGISYTVTTYLGTCNVKSVTSTDCVQLGTGISYLRAVVAVTWTGQGCTSSAAPCTYVTATLFNTDDDPVFNTNRATPPVKPQVTAPGNQVSTVGASESLQLTVDDNTGVPPLTWQVTSGTLPTGLTLSASGLISGVPTSKITSTPLTVTVTDAFGRTGSASFTWTVVGPPTVTAPAAQTSNQGQAVSLAVASTCPHTPCLFTLAGAPAGLSINVNTGVITGTPTTIAVSAAVTVTITDADNVSATSTPFSWTVVAGLAIDDPAPLNATVGSIKARALNYTCPTTTCTVALTGTVPGMGLSTSSTTATNNTTVTLPVAQGSGTIYVAGAIQATAVPSGTSKVWNPVVKITSGASSDTSAAGTWTIFAKPTIGAVGTRNATVGSTKNIPIAYTCPNAPCVFTLANTIPGLGLSATSGVTTTNNTVTLTVTGTSGTIYINGKVGATAVPTGTTKAYATTLTITDSDAAAASSTGTWTASSAPNITNPGSQAAQPNQNLALQLTAACPNGGCTWYAEAQVNGDTTWNVIPISTTGKITYPSAPAGSYLVRVTVTDSDGITDQVTFTITVQAFAFVIPTQTTTKPTSGTKVVTLDVSNMVSPLADGYTFTISGQPTWLAISTDGILTATVTTTSVTDTAITVTATSTASPTSTVASTFRWTIS
jgi:Putative Ig domain